MNYKKLYVLSICLGCVFTIIKGQTIVDSIDINQVEKGTIAKVWLKMIGNGLSQPVTVPIIIARGKKDYPVLGMTAAIHGNELNGIPIIQKVFEDLDVENLEGVLIGIPGLNAISLPNHRRRYIDEEDLNRNFPGKVKGNRSQQYVWQINQKILSQVDYLIDMHTASFGRVNTLYVRADMQDSTIAKMALAQDADIILDNKGIPSFGDRIAATRTMRAEAVLQGKPTITVEYANPQVYQPEIIERGVRGVNNTLKILQMMDGEQELVEPAIRCKKSFWIYVEESGLLEIPVELGQIVKKGQLIGILKDPFGDLIREYTAPQKGIVIGKSTNPVNMNGGRIIHLGILEKE